MPNFVCFRVDENRYFIINAVQQKKRRAPSSAAVNWPHGAVTLIYITEGLMSPGEVRTSLCWARSWCTVPQSSACSEVEENTKGCSRSQWQSQAFRGQHRVSTSTQSSPPGSSTRAGLVSFKERGRKEGRGRLPKLHPCPWEDRLVKLHPPLSSLLSLLGCAKGTSAPRHYLTADITGVVMAMIYARISHCSTSTIDWRTIGKNAHFKVPVIQRLRVGENRLDSFHPSDSSSDI